MKQPAMHDKLHPMKVHRWNPYKDREYVGHILDQPYFNAMNSGDHDLDSRGHGCVDAPDDIPCGSTLCIRTIGGWDREQYNLRDRECEDWLADERAIAETAEMIRGILAEIDAEEGRPA